MAGHISGPGQRQFCDFAATPGHVVSRSRTGGCAPSSEVHKRVTTATDLDSANGYLTTCLDCIGLRLPSGGAYTVEVLADDDSGFTLGAQCVLLSAVLDITKRHPGTTLDGRAGPDHSGGP